MPESPFSFDEIRQAGKAGAPEPRSISASDGTALAYRLYRPDTPRAVVLFYHGGGAHSGAGYHVLGAGLETRFGVAACLPDLRGHGASGGPRGDAPSPEQVWADVTTFVRHLRAEYPALPLFIGGHSSGAGMILNYLSQPDHEPADGYVFLSPQLGERAQVDRPTLAAPFATVDPAAFAAYARSGGRACAHEPAVKFNYPAEVLRADPGLVAAITVSMSMALVPAAPREQFAALDRPFGLWIGAEDELFAPDKVLAFADLARGVRAASEASLVPGAGHLSILVRAHEVIGPWAVRESIRAGMGL